ncbi:hypothetical protein QN375_24830 [Pseudomonas sp. MH9.2]|uniref:hypothetical protein n=1 Tax=unclassified Pseudomonas TaxID=196821 RepID=UPI002AC8B9AA|nr:MULTISPECIES: hypothetical protein [unclassified Pseudomonas]MEB0028953.1 hypothetical protein [Pseudomonas sp. MH9.2]MEB0120929.1 hypothetical protein [Pseudomonas sp. CCI1.2]WPX67797.1 hypothetical protein RHM55_18825 [Pseudomonas sp. MH9.2]
MNALDVVSTGALMLLGLILLVLLIQTLRLRDIWQMMLGCQKAARWASIWEMENKELRSALRAEKEHVEQLKRKLVILQTLTPAA